MREKEVMIYVNRAISSAFIIITLGANVQGGVISPIMFNLYLDNLFILLKQSDIA